MRSLIGFSTLPRACSTKTASRSPVLSSIATRACALPRPGSIVTTTRARNAATALSRTASSLNCRSPAAPATTATAAA